MKKRFSHIDAAGTDGTDPSKTFHVYNCVDDDNFTIQVRVPSDTVDHDTVLKESAGTLEAAVDIGIVIPKPVAPAELSAEIPPE